MSFQPGAPTSQGLWLPTAEEIRVILSGGAAEPPPPDPGGLRAFPGAAGYGAEAMLDADWDDVRVYQVTSLASSGAGTFRQAIIDAHTAPSTAAKFIVFRTGGWIAYNGGGVDDGDVGGGTFDGKNIYVAGQTAPGGGAGLGGPTFGSPVQLAMGSREDFHTGPVPESIIWRYLTIRNGPNLNQLRHSSCMLIQKFDKCMIDHCSLSWAEGRTMGGQDGPLADVEARKLTYSHNIIFESLAFHPSGHTLSGDRDSYQATGISNSTHISTLMNHFASNRQRNPNFRECQYSEFVNNVTHNCRRVAWYGDRMIHDHVANYHTVGPFNEGLVPITVINTNETIHPLGMSLYAAGNFSDQYEVFDPDADNWDDASLGPGAPDNGDHSYGLVGWHSSKTTNPPRAEWDLINFKRTKRFWETDAFVGTNMEGASLPVLLGAPAFPHIILAADTARDLVLGTGLQGAGNIHGINASGEWFTRIDSVDQRAKDEALGNVAELVTMSGGNGRESVSSGDYPTMAAGTAPTDTDSDGLPDAYCTKWGLSTSGNKATVLISVDFPSSPIADRPHIWAYINGVSPEDGTTQMAS